MIHIKNSTQSLHLRVLDQPITIQSDSTALHTLFQQMYSRFIVPTVPIGATIDSPPIVVKQNLIQEELDSAADQVSVFDVSRLLRTYVTQVRTHLLIHAGVLSYGGQGILLVAPSMYGKTTLTLKLLRDGFNFLSDDIAALGLRDHLVHPFPRAFVIRPGSLDLAGFSSLPPETPTWRGKQIVDAETLCPNCMGKPVPIRHIFFLHNEIEEDIERQHNAKRQNDVTANDVTANDATAAESFELLLTSLPSDLEHALPTITGIQQIAIGMAAEQVRLEVRAKNRLMAMREIDSLCQAHNVELIYLDERSFYRPTFNSPAKLTKISHSRATINLLEQFLGGYHSELFRQEMSNSPIRLSMTIARIIQNANCYQLRVGPLQEMADLVHAAVNI